MLKPKNRAHHRPKASAKSNSWFRMQASADNEADIYIYDEIGYWGVTAHQFVNDLKALGDITHINLHINSPGGDVFDGIAIFNALKHHGAAITVHIDGLAASMASVIAMVGNPVIMPENTMMMIHKPWGFAGGDANDMRDYADLLDKVESALIPAYAEKTGKTTEEVAAMLEDETWMDGKECLEHGFADQVTTSLQAMACIQSKRIEDFEKMPNSIRNMITPPRNTTQREPQQPQPQVATTTTTAPAATSDEATIRAQVLAEQKNRVNAINDLFAMFGGKHHELQNKCIADPECTVAQAKDDLLAALGKTATPSNKTTDAHIYAGNGNFVGDGVRQALMARAGFESMERDNVYNGMTLREYARMALTERGIGVSSYNPMQMVGMALTHSTSDFGNILLDVANKALLQGWEEAAETFEQWTKKGQLSDFKTAHRVGLGGFSSLRQVREGAEYKYVTTKDKGESIALATYGEIFSITRQAIINDDLNQLTDVPMKMGRAAKGTIGDLVYAVLTENAKLSDGKPLFHADHGNISAGAISVASLDEARKMMRLQKEGERPLNIRPAFMLVPVALETLANQTIKSASVKGADINAGIMNPIQNFAEVIAEPRLDAKDTSAWYLAAAKGTDTIEVAYLNGVDTPYIDQQEGFTTDGIATKVRIDAGVSPLDYRGLAKSTGK
ncbi:Clp protease ClpP [Salmonella enterica]|nr:Clp protease ClpP [Salmonella enterica]EGK5006433.1 Clp protease ClpP [Salmonella enterica]EGN1781321.1 Clp protease ClpP [Salmonella enterica]